MQRTRHRGNIDDTGLRSGWKRNHKLLRPGLIGGYKLRFKRRPRRGKQAVWRARFERALAADDRGAEEMQLAPRSRAGNIKDTLALFVLAHLALLPHPLIQRMRVTALAADRRD